MDTYIWILNTYESNLVFNICAEYSCFNKRKTPILTDTPR